MASLKRLATAALRFVSGLSGEETFGGEAPLAALARRGISSAGLTELYFSAASGEEACHCSLAVTMPAPLLLPE